MLKSVFAVYWDFFKEHSSEEHLLETEIFCNMLNVSLLKIKTFEW